MTVEAVTYAALTVSFSVNAVFMKRLLAKLDRIADAIYNVKDGVIVRLDRLERGLGNGPFTPHGRKHEMAR